MTLTPERLRDVLKYDPNTGSFVWIKSLNPRGKIGSEAGCTYTAGGGRHHKNTYRAIRIDGTLYQAHRLAWLYMTGEWPTDMVDHINHDGTDNRWSNLRQATAAQNGANSRPRAHRPSSMRGAVYRKDIGKWQSYCGRKRIGLFDTLEEANAAYRKAAGDTYGEFASQ